MHFAIQPLRPHPQRNAKRTQQPTCHLCVPSPRPCTTHTKHSRKTHMNQAVVRAPNSTQQHEKQQHTLAAYRKTQEEQALTNCTARRRAKSISSTHMQRAQNIIMHFAIQPFYDPPRSATQNARSSPHAMFVFHHCDHAQPTQNTAERHSTQKDT